MNPLEDVIVALRPVSTPAALRRARQHPAARPTMPAGSTPPIARSTRSTGNPVTVANHVVNFGWEYVWHCHLLGHEENDMMRPIEFNAVKAPAAPSLSGTGPVRARSI